MCIHWGKTFSLVPRWRSCIKVKVRCQGYIFSTTTLTLKITFEWQEVELSYFTCVLIVIRSFLWYQSQCRLQRLNIQFTFFYKKKKKNFNIDLNFWMVSYKAFMLPMIVCSLVEPIPTQWHRLTPLGNKPFENTLGKREMACYEQFLLFP